MLKRVLVAFDFDHTLLDDTIDFYVMQLLPNGGELPPSVQELYSIDGWNDYQREVFRYLHSCNISREQLLSSVGKIPLVKGMRELLEYLVASKTMAAKVNTHNVSSSDDIEIPAHAKVAENGVFSSQHQQSVINGAESLKNSSSSSVQFDVIIVSDANSVSICQSIWFSPVTFVFVYLVTTRKLLKAST